MAHPIHEATENSPYGNLTKEELYKKHNISHQEIFMMNKQNMKIFTQSWQPAQNTLLKGLIGMIHGYTSESSWIFELNAIALAKSGYYICALDLQGHDLAEGSPDHVPDVNPLLQDCLQFFDSARAHHPNLPHFLYGESLGGAIAILMCLQQKTAWKGLVLSGEMCEVSTKCKPIWPLEKFLPFVALIAPNWRVAISRPIFSQSYKEKWMRKLVERSPNKRTNGKPTAGTALQLLKVCEYVKRNCHELEVPMLIMHGGDDMVCDPKGATYLYESACSKDKTLEIFSGMWHLLIGEPSENVEKVFSTMLLWIEARANLTK